MSDRDREREVIYQIDAYDRQLGDILATRGAIAGKMFVKDIVEKITGRAQTFQVQTYRVMAPIDGKEDQTQAQFWMFVKFIEGREAIKLAIPPSVCDAIARQRDALATTARKRTAKRVAQERRARGEVLGNVDALRAYRTKAKKAKGKGKKA